MGQTKRFTMETLSDWIRQEGGNTLLRRHYPLTDPSMAYSIAYSGFFMPYMV